MDILDFVSDIHEPDLVDSLDSLAYYISERGQWVDCVDSVSPEQVILCWKIVEKLKFSKIPDELVL